MPPSDERPPRREFKPTAVTWWALGLGLISMASAFWSWWAYWPSWAAPLEIAAPPLILLSAALFPGALILGPREAPDRRASLYPALFAALLGLAVGAWREFDTLLLDANAMWAAAAALLGGGAIALLVSRIDREHMSDTLMVVFTMGAGALWTAGLLLEANAHLPPRRLGQQPVVVVDKEYWSGRGGSYYRLWLQVDHGPPPARMAVEAPLYQRTSVGDRLCVIRTEGGLKLVWWKVGDCHRP